MDGSAVLAQDADEWIRTEFHEKSQKALSTLVIAILQYTTAVLGDVI